MVAGGFAIATAVPAGSLIGGGLGAGGGTTTTAGVSTLTTIEYTAAQAAQIATTNSAVYLGLNVVYGVVMPEGSPDLPGPGNEVGGLIRSTGGKAVKTLGQRAKEFLSQAIKSSQASKAKYGEQGLVMMAKKADIRLVDRVAKAFGLTEGQRELMHHDYADLKDEFGLIGEEALRELAGHILKEYPNK